MSDRLEKKIRKRIRRNWRAFYDDILERSFWQRLAIAWYIVWHYKATRKPGKGR